MPVAMHQQQSNCCCCWRNGVLQLSLCRLNSGSGRVQHAPQAEGGTQEDGFTLLINARWELAIDLQG